MKIVVDPERTLLVHQIKEKEPNVELLETNETKGQEDRR